MSVRSVGTLVTLLWLVAGCGGGTGLGGPGNNNNDVPPDCGDGLLQAGEQCDGDELAGLTCEALGGVGGVLACAADCTLDESGCVFAGPCGDGLVDVGEECDGDDLNGASCESLGYDGGTLACTGSCAFDPAACTLDSCGDGVVEGIEQCDDANTVAGDGCGASCAVEEGWECQGEPSVCVPIQTCGNGQVDADEECDGADLNGTTCADLGYDAGTLTCGVDCTFDETGCSLITCGNGTIDAGEECDGLDLAGADCTDFGAVGGTLACGSSCSYDLSQCQFVGPCGDGLVDPGEQCDGANLDGETCQSLGFDSGALACAADCTFETSQCAMASCGDGLVQAGEQCDGNNLNGESCASLGYTGGALGCSGTCTFDISSCTGVATCGNGQIEPGEQCDGANLGGQDCLSLGFGGGTLGCTGGCDFDTSGCTAPSCSATGGPLSCPANVSSNTGTSPLATDVVDAYTGAGCANWPMTGPEIVYAFNPGSTSENVEATLTGLSADLDLIVLEGAGAGCDASLACLDWSDAGGTTNEAVSFLAQANTDYYVVVDGYNGAQSAFVLDLICVQPLRQIYEWFTWNAGDTWDLQGTTITFTPDSTAPNGYTWTATTGVTSFPTPLSAAALQVPFTAEDDSYEHAFGPGQAFPFFDGTYTSVWVNSHANVTFGAGDTAYEESAAALAAGPPRIAGEWDRINVLDAGGGRVWVQQLNNRVAVTWDYVSDYFGYADHALQIELFWTGQIAITNLQAGGDDGLCGISEGGGGTGPGEVNFVP